MKKQCQNVQSTKQKVTQNANVADELTHALGYQHLIVKVINATRMIYTNQTGWFPVQSSQGHRLIMVLYDVNGNYIDVESMKDNKDNSLVAAYKQLWQRITHQCTTKPKMHILDNEASAVFKTAIKTNCDLQLVPPDTHRRNLAEQGIQFFKSHFVAILAGVDANFPMSLLNMLQQSHNNPSMSAYEYVNGPFNYSSMLLAPLGCAVQMHKATNW
jgi:hypothetical protein